MKKSSIIHKVSVSRFKAPLIQSFTTALGEHKMLDNVLLTLEFADKTKGFGEAAIATHITGETIEKTMKNLNRVGRDLIGRDGSDYFKISADLHERLLENKAAVAAIEMALMDALTRHWKIPLWRFFGRKSQRLTTDITLVISDLEETEKMVKKFYQKGFRIFKVKVGRNQDLDFKRVVLVRKLAAKGTIYLDCNQGYTAKETLQFLRSLRRAHITPQLVEQPVPKSDWEGLKKVTRLAKVTICADESVQSISDYTKLIRDKVAHAINIKLMKFGLFQARAVALLAKANGIKLMMGGMMETSLAMTAAAHVAAGLGCFDYVDLDTPFFVKEGFDRNPYLNSCGVYDLRKVKTGIGIVAP